MILRQEVRQEVFLFICWVRPDVTHDTSAAKILLVFLIIIIESQVSGNIYVEAISETENNNSHAGEHLQNKAACGYGRKKRKGD